MHFLWNENYKMNCSWQHPHCRSSWCSAVHIQLVSFTCFLVLLACLPPPSTMFFQSWHRTIIQFTLQLIPTKHLIFKIHLIKLHEIEINLSEKKIILPILIPCFSIFVLSLLCSAKLFLPPAYTHLGVR